MKAIFYFATVTSLLSLSCTKNNVHPRDTSLTDYFPNKVGDQWVYNVIDTSYLNGGNVTTSIVTVTIVGTTIDAVSGDSLTIWQYKWPNKIDSEYVEEIMDDTVRVLIRSVDDPGRFYSKVSGTDGNWEEINFYILPLIISNQYNLSNDPVNIHSILSAPNYPYSDLRGNLQSQPSFEIIRRTWGGVPNSGVTIDEIYAPHIGMVKEHIQLLGFAPMDNQYWSLISNNFSIQVQ